MIHDSGHIISFWSMRIIICRAEFTVLSVVAIHPCTEAAQITTLSPPYLIVIMTCFLADCVSFLPELNPGDHQDVVS